MASLADVVCAGNISWPLWPNCSLTAEMAEELYDIGLRFSIENLHSVAMGYVNEVESDIIQLRSERFGQSVMVQWIPLDAIVEHTYDQNRSVGAKFHGRIITLA